MIEIRLRIPAAAAAELRSGIRRYEWIGGGLGRRKRKEIYPLACSGGGPVDATAG
jgi:hypothetical protein